MRRTIKGGGVTSSPTEEEGFRLVVMFSLTVSSSWMREGDGRSWEVFFAWSKCLIMKSILCVGCELDRGKPLNVYCMLNVWEEISWGCCFPTCYQIILQQVVKHQPLSKSRKKSLVSLNTCDIFSFSSELLISYKDYILNKHTYMFDYI